MRTLFLVVDSLRADALGCYGARARTPSIDALASGGARFETVISSAPWTLPSLAAMLTGQWSHRLGLMKWEQPWPREVPTLFDAFRARRIETASFVFDPDFLFRSCDEAGVVGSSQDTEPMLQWFRGRRHRDYLAFVHYWWTHVPYVARKLPLSTWSSVTQQILGMLSATDPERRRANREQVEGLYTLAVQELDERWLPALLDAANADVIVLVSDHGESWGERLGASQRLGDVFDLHGNHLHDEVIRIPWILHAPGLVPPTTVKGLARSVDIAPTLVELLDLRHPMLGSDRDAPAARAGRSLASALASGRIAGEAPAFAARNVDLLDASTLPRDPREAYVEMCCRDLSTKVIGDFRGESANRYDLVSDPGELHPVALDGSTASPLADALRDETAAAVVAPHDPDDFVRMRQRLTALGYL